jgi:hypothetical protein
LDSLRGHFENTLANFETLPKLSSFFEFEMSKKMFLLKIGLTQQKASQIKCVQKASKCPKTRCLKNGLKNLAENLLEFRILRRFNRTACWF